MPPTNLDRPPAPTTEETAVAIGLAAAICTTMMTYAEAHPAFRLRACRDEVLRLLAEQLPADPSPDPQAS